MIHNIKIEFDRKEILRYLGYKEGMDLPTNIIDIMDRTISYAYKLVEPKGMYKTVRIKSVDKSEIRFLDSEFIIESKSIADLLRDCQYASIVAVTIGNVVQKQIDELFKKGEYTEALILDAIGSDGAEKTAEAINNIVYREALLEGYHITDPFSPGYGDFSLDYQINILKELKTDRIITVTESNILVPRKSVTAIVGWSRNRKTSFDHKCSNCNLKGCEYR